MNTKATILACLAFAATAGVASAQPAGPYVSGLLHDPLGGAVLTPIDEQTVRVGNIGSSGNDGVEIQCTSAFGASVTVDLSPLLGATGVAREIKIRPKGWDGTVKGSARLASDPGGVLTEECDFSDIGASAVKWRLVGATGEVLADGLTPGAIVSWGLISSAPVGAVANKAYFVSGDGTAMRSANQGFFDLVAVTGLTPDPVAGVQAIEVSPEPCAGLPENCPPTWADVSSLLVTASDVGELVVSDAGLRTFGVHSSGVGQAHISEECVGGSACPRSDRKLVVRNLGSSGQDGVEIGLPPNNSGASASLAKGNCCRGHVIIMKLYDDEGQEARVIQTQTNDPSGTEELDADFSSLGASGYRLTLLDALGAVVGPPGGTAVASGAPRPTFISHCSPGQTESWDASRSSGPPGRIVVVRRATGCTGGYDFLLPGYGEVTNVAAFAIEPLKAASGFGKLARCVFAGTDPGGLVIGGIDVHAGTYVSGLLHQPLGYATTRPAGGRRLPIRNLGSSGEDGVSVRVGSHWGGSVTVELTPLLNPPPPPSGYLTTQPAIKIRHKGWDGLIYGNHRVIGSGSGPSVHHVFDFSPIGAESIDWALVDVNGDVVDQGNVTGSALEYDEDIAATDPASPPTMTYKVNVQDLSFIPMVPKPTHRVLLRNASSTVTSLIWSPRSNIAEVRLVPRLPIGAVPPGVTDSLDVTGSGLDGFDVTESTIGAFGAECFAEQPGTRLFERLPEGAYPPPDRWLEALSETGQPDVSVSAGQTGTPGSLAMSAKGNCCRGHVIIMKAYDDENQEVGRLIKTHDPVAGQSSVAFDCSAVGSAECDVELFDSSGASIATVRVPNGTAFTFADTDADCPGGTDNEWRASSSSSPPAVQKLRETRCTAIASLALPDGSAVSDVRSYACTPVSPLVTTSGRRLRLAASATYSDAGSASLIVTGASFTPNAPHTAADFDGDSDVDLADFAVFQGCFNGPNRPPAQADCAPADSDGDGDVDLGDFAVFQGCFNGPNRPPACL